MFGVLSLPLPSRPLAGWLVDLIHFAFSLLFFLSHIPIRFSPPLSLFLSTVCSLISFFLFSPLDPVSLCLSLSVRPTVIHPCPLSRSHETEERKQRRTKGRECQSLSCPSPVQPIAILFLPGPF